MPVNRRRFAIAFGCTLAAITSATSVRAQDVVRVVHPYSSHGLVHEELLKRVPDMAAATDFSVRFEIYSSMELGIGRDLLVGLNRGYYDFVLAPANFLSGKLVGIDTLARTDLFESYDQWRKFPGSNAESEVASLFGRGGLEFVGSTWLSTKHLMLANPIEDFRDLAGLKLRVSVADAGLSRVVETLGASAVGIGRKEVYSALQAGVVDGAVQSLGWFDARMIQEAGGAVIANPLGGQVGWLVGREGWRSQLAPTIDEYVRDAFSVAMEKLGRELELQEKERFRRLKEGGGKVLELDAASMQMFRDAAERELNSELSGTPKTIVEAIGEL